MIALINPNTSAETTTKMLRIARETVGRAVRIEGLTAPFGAHLIIDKEALDRAAEAVVAMAPKIAGAKAVIVAAFGDPGLGVLRARLPIPVTGIAEAGMAEAAEDGRRFAVVTTTPLLRYCIAETAADQGYDSFIGTWTTPGDPVVLTTDYNALLDALAVACFEAIVGGAEAIVIGGGPLAEAARALVGTTPVPLIEPLPAAVRLTLSRLSVSMSE
jgi:allantoin racemase